MRIRVKDSIYIVRLFSSCTVIDELLHSTLLTVSKMAESRDEDTGDHIDRMKIYFGKIAEYLLIDHIYEDFEIMKKHTIYGAEVFSTA